MTMLRLLGAVVPIAVAFMLLQATRWDHDSEPASPAFIVALGLGFGFGLSSCTFFLSLVGFSGTRAAVVTIDMVLAVIAAVIWWRRARPRRGQNTPARLPARDVALATALLIAALAGVASFAVNTLAAPHGQWDAWSTWNLRARWLASAGPTWPSAFAESFPHADYPLLVPGIVARLWVYGDADPTAVPAAVAAAYASALVLVLYGALATLRGRTQALVGALCLLGTPLFLRNVSWQYADIPLAFYILAALALLAVRDHDPGAGRSALLWAGVAAGLAAWTKNEGLLVVACITAVRGVLTLADPRSALESAKWFLSGLFPPAVVVALFKLTLSPESHQFTEQRGVTLAQLADPTRYLAIANAVGFELTRGVGVLLIGLAMYVGLLGRTSDHHARYAARAAAYIIGLVGLGDVAVYATASYELGWLLAHSLDRLVLQLRPSVLFVFFLYSASPAEWAVSTVVVQAIPMRRASARAAMRERSRRRR